MLVRSRKAVSNRKLPSSCTTAGCRKHPRSCILLLNRAWAGLGLLWGQAYSLHGCTVNLV